MMKCAMFDEVVKHTRIEDEVTIVTLTMVTCSCVGN